MKGFAGKAANRSEVIEVEDGGLAEISRLQVTINCTLTALRFHLSVGSVG